MGTETPNAAQAEFWTQAGPLWTSLKDRFDAQADEHGVRAIDALAPAPGERVVDVGCGTGTSTLQLAERVGAGGAVLGVDISPTMVESAKGIAERAGAANVRYLVADAMLVGVDERFDALFSRFGLMFFADPAAAFANLGTWLRPGGRIGFTSWQSPQANPWASVPLRTVAEFVEMPLSADPSSPGPFSLADPERVSALLEGAGYTDVTIAPHARDARIGADLADAVEFLCRLAPPVVELETRDPDAARALRERLSSELARWATPTGVDVPSASWIVTARRPS
jgi:SAM-dependent methyltransferase